MSTTYDVETHINMHPVNKLLTDNERCLVFDDRSGTSQLIRRIEPRFVPLFNSQFKSSKFRPRCIPIRSI